MQQNPYQTPTAPVADASRPAIPSIPVQRLLLAVVLSPLAAIPATGIAIVMVFLLERQLMPIGSFATFFVELAGVAVVVSYVAVLTYGLFVLWLLRRLRAFSLIGVLGAAMIPGLLLVLFMTLTVGNASFDKMLFLAVLVWAFSMPVAIVFWAIVVGYVPPGLRRAAAPEA